MCAHAGRRTRLCTGPAVQGSEAVAAVLLLLWLLMLLLLFLLLWLLLCMTELLFLAVSNATFYESTVSSISQPAANLIQDAEAVERPQPTQAQGSCPEAAACLAHSKGGMRSWGVRSWGRHACVCGVCVCGGGVGVDVCGCVCVYRHTHVWGG
jgi:hypothetical protein